MQLRRHCLSIRALETFETTLEYSGIASAPFLEVDLIDLEAQNQGKALHLPWHAILHVSIWASTICSSIPAAWRRPHRYLLMLTFGWRQSRSRVCWSSCASPLPRHVESRDRCISWFVMEQASAMRREAESWKWIMKWTNEPKPKNQRNIGKKTGSISEYFGI